MTWQTPIGERVLKGKELGFYAFCVGGLRDWVQEIKDGSDPTDVCFDSGTVFEQLPYQEKVTALLYAILAMSRTETPALDVMGRIDLTNAVILEPFRHAERMLAVEIDSEAHNLDPGFNQFITSLESVDLTAPRVFAYLWRKITAQTYRALFPGAPCPSHKSRRGDLWVRMVRKLARRIAKEVYWQEFEPLEWEEKTRDLPFSAAVNAMSGKPFEAPIDISIVFTHLTEIAAAYTPDLPGTGRWGCEIGTLSEW